MALNYISAAEAASLIKHGYNIGLSGFTPAGTAKAVTAELAKIAEAEHAKGNPFQIGIFTGASTGDSCDGILSRAKAIRYRAPYTTNADFRKAVNNGEIAYNDIYPFEPGALYCRCAVVGYRQCSVRFDRSVRLRHVSDASAAYYPADGSFGLSAFLEPGAGLQKRRNLRILGHI